MLPRVHSDWPLYDLAGQSGHIHELSLSYLKQMRPGLYGRVHAGLLEPFFAGFGGEILYKPAQWPIGIGVDIHRVRKRDYDMRFDLRNYETTVGHVSLYYDVGGMFDIELNTGRYLAGDWGATATISRKFGSGWEVGGYATLTDVPFDTFGEGSFDKAIYVSLPIDWIISSPTRSKRRLTLRPITRDGGANLTSARKLYRHIEKSQSAEFKREFGRLCDEVLSFDSSDIFLTSACSNSSEFEKGEIEALKMLRETIISIGKPKMILDTRSIITREKIDNAKVPVLFIELKNSQNGTLTMYPGQGLGNLAGCRRCYHYLR